MSSTSPPSDASSDASPESPEPSAGEMSADDDGDVFGTEASLSPKLDPRLALGAPHLIIVSVLSAVFLVANYLPLRGTDLWLHVLYGNWILEHGRLPQQEQFMPYSQGMEFLDTQWLSQLIIASVNNLGGAELLSSLFAFCAVVINLCLAYAIHQRTKSLSAAALGICLSLIVGWSRLGTIRPEVFGVICFVGLLALLSRFRSWPMERDDPNGGPALGWWIASAALFAVWANLHGSFVTGLILLGCFALGDCIESLWRNGSLRDVLSDQRVQRSVYLLEFCFLGSLLTPFGFDLPLYVALFSGNENLQEVLEWRPLVIQGVGGRTFAAAIVVAVVALRQSRVRIGVGEYAALIVFGLAAAYGVRMLSWFAPLYAWVLTPHIVSTVRVWTGFATATEPTDLESSAVATADTDTPTEPLEPSTSEPELATAGPNLIPPGRSFHYSLACLVIPWTAFALTPTATPLLGGGERTATQLLGEATPVGLSEHLSEFPVDGPFLCPQQWSDWLIYAGDENLQPLVTSNIHMVPRQVWVDYLAMLNNRTSWDGMLERYRITAVALDKASHGNQIRRMRRQEGWRIAYEDAQAVLFREAGE